MEDFIEKNRKEIVEAIKNYYDVVIDENDDDEIENWILNDEGLYNWAIYEGVDV